MVDENRLLAQRYAVGALIGRGGMADVYQGTDTKLGRTVAIKILKADLATDPAFRSRFRQEAQAASRMAHPTIVRVYDAGEDSTIDADGHRVLEPFIIMEFVSGRTLKSVISGGPIESQRAVRIAADILTALEYSHRAGVVHRDIKPGNIMLGADDTVKVMDFGIARAVSESSATVAQTTAILGTASYFSPEQAKGETVDARTDLYSTSVVIFEMLTGRAPFRGDTAVAVAYQHVSEAPVRPSEINPDVSPALDAVVLRGLTKDRNERYQSAAEFREELLLAGQGTVPAPRPEPEAATQLFGAVPTTSTSTEQALRQLTAEDTVTRTQRRPPVAWIWAGVAVLAVILVAVMIWVISIAGAPSVVAKTQEVPAVTGFTQANAVEAIRGLGFTDSVVEENNDTVPTGTVIRTDPASGVEAEQGSVVSIFVSIGPKTVLVPKLANLSQADAEAKLAAAGLELGAIIPRPSALLAAGTVIDSIPGAEQAVAPGSRVDLNISDGTVQLTDMRNNTLEVASATLRNLGLDVRPKPDPTCPTREGDIVVSQSLSPGSVPQGSTIELGYCTGTTPPPPAPETSTPPATPAP